MKKSVKLIFATLLAECNLNQALAVASHLIEDGVDLPVELEAIVLDFLTEKSVNSLITLLKEVMTHNEMLTVKEQVVVLVFFTQQGWLSLQNVATLLSSIPYVVRRNLSLDLVQLIEIAELVYEDEEEKYMAIEQDNLLNSAIQKICVKEFNLFS